MNVWRWLFWPVVSTFWRTTSLLIAVLVQALLVVSLLFGVAYRLGWCHRLVWSIMEAQASRAMNGAPVTIGSFAVDWLRGHVLLNNVLIHAPRRATFHWESPVVARLGRVRLEFNPLSCAFAYLVLNETVPKVDVTLLHLSDIQCFLERQGQVFNVYLLDPFYILPPEAAQQEEELQEEDDVEKNAEPSLLLDTAEAVKEPDLQMSNSSFGGDDTNTGAVSAATEQPTDVQQQQQQRAELVVGEMLKAVQSLGRAVQEGHLPAALHEQRLRIAQGLKEFHNNTENNNSGGNQNNKEAAAAAASSATAGLHLVHEVSKMVVQKSQAAVQHSNLIWQHLQPQRRPMPPPPPHDLFLARFGRVILDDLRVFTRTTLSSSDEAAAASPTKTAAGTTTGATTPVSSPTNATEAKALATTTPNKNSSSNTNNKRHSYWNKPIAVDRVAVRASEFGAPLSAKDEITGFPVLFQPLDKSLDAIFKRVVGDMAKANTGRLVRTAMGEVLDFYMEKEYYQDAYYHKQQQQAQQQQNSHHGNKEPPAAESATRQK